MSTPDGSSPQPNHSSLSFTQGLLLGQLSVVLLIGAFIKFFIFGEVPSPPSRSSGHRASHSKHLRTPSLHSLASSKSSLPQTLRHKSSANNVLRPVLPNATNTASILRKTYYSPGPDHPTPQNHGKSGLLHPSHQPESLDWFNVLIAQTIAEYRQTAYNLRDASPSEAPSILSSLTAALNNPEKRPSFIDTINVTEISLGEEFPIFSNCRVIALEDDNNSNSTNANNNNSNPSQAGGGGGRLQALMDVDLSEDNLTLAIETSLILNYPKPFSAVLPLALAVSVVRFSGTLSISFVPAPPAPSDPPTPRGSTPAPNTNGSPKTNLAFSFLPDYRLELSVRSLVGSRSRLQDVPKIAQLVEGRVQAWFEERVVEPRVQIVGLPGLWPRMGKTRLRRASEDAGARQDSWDGFKGDGPFDNRREEMVTSADAPTGASFGGGNDLRARGRETGARREESMKMPGALPT